MADQTPTDDEINELVDRVAGFEGSPKMEDHLGQLAKLASVPASDWGKLYRNPNLMARMKRELDRRFEFALFAVYDALFDKCMKGDTPAMKLFFQRFDRAFIERVEQRRTFDADSAPTREEFCRMMANRLGDVEWEAAKIEAKKSGRLGGVFGEEYLEGGAMEGQEPEIIDVKPVPETVPASLPGPDREDGAEEDWF